MWSRSPHQKGVIKDIEKIQKRANKLVISLKHLLYKDRLVQLDLPILKYRRLRGDIIEVYKIINQKYDCAVAPKLIFNPTSVTRVNNYRLFKQRCHYDLRKVSFTHRIVNIWNSLHNTGVEVDTDDKFKWWLDKFWMYQDIKIVYLTGLFLLIPLIHLKLDWINFGTVLYMILEHSCREPEVVVKCCVRNLSNLVYCKVISRCWHRGFGLRS